ncbi:MAG: IPT/TIG domain-containing protein [Candidatus Roizmanbacteria bacterium]
MSSYATNFDYTSNTFQITFTGSNFDGTSSTIAVYVDGYLQTTLSVSSTTVVAEITDMDDLTSSDISLYLASGTPSGYAALTSITVTPALVSVTPSIGSPAGSVITANI